MQKNRKIGFFVKLIVSLCLIAWIIAKVNIDDTLRIIYSVKIVYLVLGCIWIVLDRFLMSYRWNILLAAKNIFIPFLQIVKICFIGAFSGNFLPSSIAPDAVRVYFASKYSSNTTDIVSSVFIDRILGLVSLAVIALFSILFIFLDRGEIHRKALWVVLAMLFLVAVFLFSEKALNIIPLDKFRNFLSRWGGWVAYQSFEKFYISCNEYKKNLTDVWLVLFLSFIVQGLSIVAIYVLAQSVNVDISLLNLFVFVPLMNLLIMVPVSIGGIGVQEGAFLYYFSQIGISTQAALSVALLFRAVTIAGSLPGGVFYAIEGTGNTRSPSPNRNEGVTRR